MLMSVPIMPDLDSTPLVSSSFSHPKPNVPFGVWLSLWVFVSAA